MKTGDKAGPADNVLIKGDEVKYNAVAVKIMSENGIAIDHLHAEVLRLGQPKTNNLQDTGDLSTKVANRIVGALASRRTVAKGEEARPNFLIILADDLGFSDLGCYGSDIAAPQWSCRFLHTQGCLPEECSAAAARIARAGDIAVGGEARGEP